MSNEMVYVILPAPKNCWWYEMHIAGMVGQTIYISGKPHRVVYTRPIDGDDDMGFERAHAMRLELEPVQP